jgi:hypothetical protein
MPMEQHFDFGESPRLPCSADAGSLTTNIFIYRSTGNQRASRGAHLRAHASESSPYLERGIVNDLGSGSGKSRQGEIAGLCRERENKRVQTNEYRDDSEPFSVPNLVADAVDRTEQEPGLDRVTHNRVLRVGNSPSGAIAGAIASRGPFPLRTLIVCFTIWLIATQAMIFDQIKFDARAHLLEQTARSFGGPQVVVPNERQYNPSTGAKVQRL